MTSHENHHEPFDQKVDAAGIDEADFYRHDDDDVDLKQESMESPEKGHDDNDNEEMDLMNENPEEQTVDESCLELIKNSQPNTDLEKAYAQLLDKKDVHIRRLTNEIGKLKAFISKRKQTYKRKRKESSAPTRALSAYNIFVQDRFAQLAKENEKALKSTDTDAQLKRVPPANLVASTGNQWKALPPEEKAKYEERAKADRKRYEEQMAAYQPPDRASNKKRNKTGYNMFFSAHVLRLRQSDSGVPSERGSVARLVGLAWKALSAEEKQYYEREADKHNGMHPVKDDVDEDDDEDKRHHQDPYAHYAHPDMHMHAMGMPQHDPRHHGYPYGYPYAQPAYHYDYQQHQQHYSRHSQGRGGYHYPSQRSPYGETA